MGIALYLFCVRLGLLLKNQLHRPYSPVSILFKEPITLSALLATDLQKRHLIIGYTFLPI